MRTQVKWLGLPIVMLALVLGSSGCPDPDPEPEPEPDRYSLHDYQTFARGAEWVFARVTGGKAVAGEYRLTITQAITGSSHALWKGVPAWEIAWRVNGGDPATSYLVEVKNADGRTVLYQVSAAEYAGLSDPVQVSGSFDRWDAVAMEDGALDEGLYRYYSTGTINELMASASWPSDLPAAALGDLGVDIRSQRDGLRSDWASSKDGPVTFWRMYAKGVGPVAMCTSEGLLVLQRRADTANGRIILAGSGTGGSISPFGATRVDYDGTQAFTITPNTGYNVADVVVNGVSVGAVRSHTFEHVTEDQTIMATFALAGHTITATAGAGGSVAPSGAVPVAHGQGIVFNATPAAHYHVADCLVDGVSVGARMNYTFQKVTADHTIHFTFALNEHTIFVVVGDHGSVLPAGNAQVVHGDDVTLQVVPNEGYRVSSVLVDNVPATLTGDSYTFVNVVGDHTFSVAFDIKRYTIVASAGTGGSIVPSGSIIVKHGDDRAFDISVSTGYSIAEVLVDGVPVALTTGSYRFENVVADHTIHATFALLEFSLEVQVQPEDGGTVLVNPDKEVYIFGEVVQLTAQPSAGFAFLDWEGDVTGDNLPIAVAITMNADKTVTALFGEIVPIPDGALNGAVRDAIEALTGTRPLGDLYTDDLEGLTTINASAKGVKSLAGLEYCTDLTHLYVSENEIADIGVLLDIPSLVLVDLQGNDLDAAACAVVATLEGRGVTVLSDGC